MSNNDIVIWWRSYSPPTAATVAVVRAKGMDGKIAGWSLVVSNKAKALEFYTKSVGFDKKTDVTGPNGYRYVTVGPKDQHLELALWEIGSATDPAQAEWSKQWAPGKSPPIGISVTDCSAAYKELSARGVHFPSPPTENPWATVAIFKDPDGNLFTLTQFKGGGPTP